MKTLQLLAIAAIAVIAASCSGKPEISYFPAKEDSGDNWGLVDAKGEFLFTDEFRSRPSAVVNNYFFVEESDGLTVYKAEKSPRQVGDLAELEACGFYNEGLMPVVRKGEHISFVDGSGKTKFILDKIGGQTVKASAGMFINGRCAVMTEDDKWGAIDTDGNVVIEPRYDRMIVFVEDCVLVKDVETGNWSIIDRNGNVTWTYDAGSQKGDITWGEGVFVDGYTAVRIDSGDGSRYAMLNARGEMTRLPSSVKDMLRWTSDYVIFGGSDGNYGIMDMNGEVLVRAKYDAIEILPNGRFIGARKDKVMYIGLDGETERLADGTYPAIRYSYPFSKVFDFGFELVREMDDEYMLVKYTGEPVGGPMARFKGRVDFETIYSDYYDYDDAAAKFVGMFDNDGLKGYPFGSMMNRYADPERSIQWYRGDRSLSAKCDESNTYFYASSLTLRSDNYIVRDGAPYESYYEW